MTPSEWDLLKMLEKDVQRIERDLIEHKRWDAEFDRRIKGLEWLARGDVEELPEPEWWGERFNQAMSIVKRLAYTESFSAFMALREEARELARRHSEKSQRRGDE